VRTPDPKVREGLWARQESTFSDATRRILAGLPPAKREAAVIDLCKVAYQSGLDRGYDMAATVFDDSYDGEF
jgi:hypothetical protein